MTENEVGDGPFDDLFDDPFLLPRDVFQVPRGAPCEEVNPSPLSCVIGRRERISACLSCPDPDL